MSNRKDDWLFKMLVIKYNILKVVDTDVKCSDVFTVQFHIRAVKSPPPSS